MKKNFTVNIGGIIFHIDDDAYELLSQYIESLKTHFKYENGKEEIIADIELRIAEMFQERITDDKQVIAIEDVNSVIMIMGKPSDFSEEHISEKTNTDGSYSKRFYRDPDNKTIGGVCSGLAAYFHTKALYIKLAFILVTIMGVGAGFIAYLVLWLVAPEARSTAEKLEMRGEKVDINTIQRSIKQEFEGIKDKFIDLKDEANQTFQKRKKDGKNVFEKLVGFIVAVFKYFFRSIVVFFGLVFITIGLFLLIGILVSFIANEHVYYVSSFGVSTFSIPAFMRLFLEPKDQTLAIIGLILTVGIPLVMLIYTGSRLIFRFKARSRFVGIPAFSLFIAGLIICVISAVQVLKNFSQRDIENKQYTLLQPKTNNLRIDVKWDSQLENLGYQDNRFVLGNWNILSTEDTSVCFGMPSLEFMRTENDSFQLVLYSSARGKDRHQAEVRASQIIYNFEQNDTALILNPYYFLPTDEKFRGQRLKILIRVPIGKSIQLSEKTNIFFNQQYFENTQDMSGRKWIMHDSGLKELNRSDYNSPRDSTKVTHILKI